MHIRQAILEDLEAIQALNSAIMEEINHRYDDDYTSQFAKSEAGRQYYIDTINNPNGVFFVAEEEASVIGFINGGAAALPGRKSRYFEIDNLGVLLSYRQRGIGSKLLDVITQWAKVAGYDKIYIESYAKNLGAINFYKKHGYSEIDISLEKKI